MLERLNLCLCNDMTTSGLTQLLASCSKILELNLGWTNLCHTDPSQVDLIFFDSLCVSDAMQVK